MTQYVLATSAGEIIQRGVFSDSSSRPIRDDQFVAEDGTLYWVWYCVWDSKLSLLTIILTRHSKSQYSSGPQIQSVYGRIEESLSTPS